MLIQRYMYNNNNIIHSDIDIVTLTAVMGLD